MEDSQKGKSFEQIAKDAENRKRMQELAGITQNKDSQQFSEAAQNLLDTLEQLHKEIKKELKKPE